jgi:hypothetical protein
MEPSFNVERLLKQLKLVAFESAVAFGLACAERMLPNYDIFSTEKKWGDGRLLREGLDVVWTSVSSGDVPGGRIRECVTGCEAVTPDTDAFDSLYVSAALDAATATVALLNSLRSRDRNAVASVASWARDSVDMYVQEVEDMSPQDPRLEERILGHSLMQQELARQREDLERLQGLRWSKDVADKLRFEWREPQVSNLGLRRP